MTKTATSVTSSLDETTIAKLCETLEPLEPSPASRVRMRDRILRSTDNMAIEATHADEGQWRVLLPGVSVKILRADTLAGTQTALWQLDAGARIPTHSHVMEEECLILQGDLEHAGTRYAAGDFLYTRPGGHHEAIHTSHGAMLLIRGERIDSASIR